MKKAIRYFNWFRPSFIILSLFFSLLFSRCTQPGVPVVILPDGADPVTITAAREMRRYVYQRTQILPEIVSLSEYKGRSLKEIILVPVSERDNQDLLPAFFTKDNFPRGEQGYTILTQSRGKKNTTVISGSDANGLLYGTYKFIEMLGVKFALHGDVLPDRFTDYFPPDTLVKGSPLFSLRGILPFHDFPEGPDWWTKEDYKAIIAQLPKMGMNFIGLHTYPEFTDDNFVRAEPTVWIGLEDQSDKKGVVNAAYPVLHFHTLGSTWGSAAKNTSEFTGGASQIFDTDNYGSTYMKDISPWPHTPEENIELFNQVGEILDEAFGFAKSLGVKTCIGTETPLTIPVRVKENMLAAGLDPETDESKVLLYQGIFKRIRQRHHLDYYWLWTPENWTWEGEESIQELPTAEKDILSALVALENTGSPFSLATCGWVLGPASDRAYFDKILPKDIPFSCINRNVGFAPVEKGFQKVSGRDKWQISWIEDDPALISPQLWAGRVRKDAVDAKNYGCNGLMGIHWRTKILDPGFDALAQAGWNIGSWSEQSRENIRSLPVDEFYYQWAKKEFGEECALKIGKIFASLDGSPEIDPLSEQNSNQRWTAKLLRTSSWIDGPGGLLTFAEPWEVTEKHFDFIEQLVACKDSLSGAGNISRFDYWLKTFQYNRELAYLGTQLAIIDSLHSHIQKEKNPERKKDIIENQVIPVREVITGSWDRMITLLLETVETRGEMGTLANLELHNRGKLNILNKYDDEFSKILGAPIPPYNLSMEYTGRDRIIVPAKRTLFEKVEEINIEVMVLSGTPVEGVTLYWKPLGGKSFEAAGATRINRDVFMVSLAGNDIPQDGVEYYIEAQNENKTLIWPATAPDLLHSFIIEGTDEN